MSRLIKAAKAAERQINTWKPPETAAKKTHASNVDSKTSIHQQVVLSAEEGAAQQMHIESVKRTAKEEGLAEGRELASQELATKQAEITKLMEEIEAERGNFFDRMEPEVARLAVTIAEKVIGKQLDERPELVIEMVKSAMRRMRDRETLRVRMNPDDVPIVRAAKEDILHEVNGVQKLDLIDDRRVGRGGCVIESNNGVMDARVKTQLEEIERVITEAATHGKPSQTD